MLKKIEYKIRKFLKIKYKCYKFDPKKVTKKDDIIEIILSQYPRFPRDLNIPASFLYMPEEEQTKMSEYIKKNHPKLKRLSKQVKDRQMSWVELDIFPSAVK